MEVFLREHGSRELGLQTLHRILKELTGLGDQQVSALLEAAKAELGGSENITIGRLLEWLGPTKGSEASQPTMDRKRVAVYGGAFDPITNAHILLAAQVVQSDNADEVWIVPSGPRPDKPNMTTPAIDRYCMCEIAVNDAFPIDFPVKVDDLDVLRKEALPTYDLLCGLQAKNPDVDLVFVIGSDWLQPGSSLASWPSRNWAWKKGDPESERTIVTGDKLLAEFDFLVVRRPGYDVGEPGDGGKSLREAFGRRMAWLEMPPGMTFIEGNLSSTEVRRRSQHEAQIQEVMGKWQEVKKICFKQAEEGEGRSAFHNVEGLVPRPVLAYMRRNELYSAQATQLWRAAAGKRVHVAVYGGAFDPITASHLTCASELMRGAGVDQVWLVPCGPRPDKPGLTSPLDRFCMCRIAVNQAFSVDFSVRVNGTECFAGESMATYDLLCGLREAYPSHDFSFVIGSDWLRPNSNIADWTSRNPDWKKGNPEEQRFIVTGQRMLEEFDFIVIPRPGYAVPPPTEDDPTGLKIFGPRLSWMTMPEGMTFIEGNLSSTELRRRTKYGKQLIGLGGLTPSGVISFIHRRQLYGCTGGYC